jgi:hypothetical protein
MRMRWWFLLEMIGEIMACYCAMTLGRRRETSDTLHRVYVWRGKDYLI